MESRYLCVKFDMLGKAIDPQLNYEGLHHGCKHLSTVAKMQAKHG